VTQGIEEGASLEQWHTGYGDMAEMPGGNGPSHTTLVNEGSAYTKKNFPLLDYLTTCTIVPPSTEELHLLAEAWPNFESQKITNADLKLALGPGEIWAYFFNPGTKDLYMCVSLRQYDCRAREKLLVVGTLNTHGSLITVESTKVYCLPWLAIIKMPRVSSVHSFFWLVSAFQLISNTITCIGQVTFPGHEFFFRAEQGDGPRLYPIMIKEGV
jgi:hypothetical protein